MIKYIIRDYMEKCPDELAFFEQRFEKGLKEKLLAAKKAGIRLVLIPKENEADLEEISEEITEGMEIVPVTEMKQVLEKALL